MQNIHSGPRRRVLILGAAGRDFHDFNMVFRDNPAFEVVAFTAAQIPNIAGRRYPLELSGPSYPDGIPILPESEWPSVVRDAKVDEVVFAYSDVRHEDVMHKACLALALGADFRLLGANSTMLSSILPVISICAVRTGCGKSPLARMIARVLRSDGLRVAVIRHPMPYGDLARQAVQRFDSLEDLDAADCTIEEREEYEPHILAGAVVYAGVDYARILALAEGESDVILWDGGNNDLPFIEPDLEIVVADPHRPGHELVYYPGEANLRRADVVVLAKVDTAKPPGVRTVRRNIRAANPAAIIVETSMPLKVEAPELITGKRVLVIEDGPTLTHGGMAYGAGILAAKKYAAAEIIDPRPYAVGSLRAVFADYPAIGPLLPAMGYSDAQVRDLAGTIAAVPCDTVVIGTPVDLRRIMHIGQAACRVTYEVEETGKAKLGPMVQDFVARFSRHA